MTFKNKQIHPKTILIFCPNWVGDVVMATPTFECIRQNYPTARLIGLIRKYARGVVEDAAWFDQILEIKDKTSRGFLTLVHEIRRLKPELAIVLPNSFRSALIARCGGVRKIYGYRRNGRNLLLSGGPSPHIESGQVIPRPMVEYYLEICRWLRLEVARYHQPRLHMSDAVQNCGHKLLEHYGISPADMVIGLNPGAKFGSSKCWPPEYFARLAELITEHWKCKLLLFIGPGEDNIGNKIVKKSTANIINTGPDKVDLALLKPLIHRCRLLFSNDTGPRHYAVAFNIPVVVIMGPTDPRYTRANLEKTIVLRRETECSPCHLKECTIDHRCMTEISPEAVLQAGKQLLRDHT
jgi:lipopolysaccharide heptosyltransferase II